MPIKAIYERNGFPLELSDAIDLRDRALSGDIVLAVSPATTGSSAAAVNSAIGGSTKYNRTITLTLKAASGAVHDWFCGTLNIAASKTSTAGVIAIEGGGSTVTFVNGVATCQLKYTGTWAAADTATLTATGTVLAKTISTSNTSVDTLIA